MKIGVTANLRKPLSSSLLRQLVAAVRSYRIEMVADPETAELLNEPSVHPVAHWPADIDILVVLGGDGTLLKAARCLGESTVPVLGVNCGSLGFLTSVSADNLERAVGCLASGDYRIGERVTASCTVLRDGREIGRFVALNDLVVSNSGQARMATLRLAIEDQMVADFLCDGLILATPTGSTGHALSAGGPIVEPTSPVFVVCPICCHTLSTRPLVVPDDSTLNVDIVRCTPGMWLAVDGQTGTSLEDADRLVFRKGTAPVRLVHLPEYAYFDVLRQKLHWRGTNL